MPIEPAPSRRLDRTVSIHASAPALPSPRNPAKVAKATNDASKSAAEGLRKIACLCCGTLLHLPIDVTVFRCSVCQTICHASNAKRSLALSQSEIRPLTPDEVYKYRKILKKASDSSVGVSPSALASFITRIEDVFSNINVMQRSFLSQTAEKSNEKERTSWKSVETFYAIVTNEPSAVTIFLQAVQKLLRSPGADFADARHDAAVTMNALPWVYNTNLVLAD